MPFDRAGTPGQGDARFDRRIVVAEPTRKALHGLQRTGRRALQPGIKLCGLPLADQRGKVLREVDRLGHLGRLGVELGELLGFRLRALGLMPQHQPGRPSSGSRLAACLRPAGEGSRWRGGKRALKISILLSPQAAA